MLCFESDRPNPNLMFLFFLHSTRCRSAKQMFTAYAAIAGGCLPEMWLALKRDVNGGKGDVENCGFTEVSTIPYLANVASSLNPSNIKDPCRPLLNHAGPCRSSGGVTGVTPFIFHQ
jgi:hypothetical protein